MSVPDSPVETRRAALAARAARLAARGDQEASAERQERCVFCSFADQQLAIPAAGVRFAAPRPPITMLPGLPAWFAGVAAPRGRLLSVIAPRGFVGLAAATREQGRFLVVLQGPAGPLGLLLDSLSGFGERPLDGLRPTPFDGGLPLLGVWDDGVGLLDAPSLLADPRVTVGAAPGATGPLGNSPAEDLQGGTR